MKDLYWSEKVFIVFICTAFLFEGIGLFNCRDYIYYIYLLIPLVLYSLDRHDGIYWRIPQKTGIILFLTILTLFISTITSIEVEVSIREFLFVISSFLIFIYVYNHKKNLQRYLIKIIIFYSVFFIIYSILLFFLRNSFEKLIPSTGYQLVYSPFGMHYHFGDYLLVPFVYLLHRYFFEKKTDYIPYIVLILAIIVMSYSRSSLISAVATISLLNYKTTSKRGKIKTILALSLGVTLLILVNILFFGKNNTGNAAIDGIKNSINSEQKTFLGNREIYIDHGWKSIKEKPFFGIGLGNFKLISNRFSIDSNTIVDTSHNLLVDIFVEGGIFLLILILYSIYLILKNGKNTYWKYVFISLLLNFQSDYTYKIYIFFLIFFISIAYMIDESDKESNPLFLGVYLWTIFLSVLIMFITSVLLYFGYRSNWMFYINPFNKNLSQAIIEKNISEKDYYSALFIMNNSAKLREGDPNYLEYIASNFEKYSNNKMAAFYIKKACLADNPRTYLSYIRRILVLDKQLLKDANLLKVFNETIEYISQKYRDQNANYDNLLKTNKTKAVESRQFLRNFFQGHLSETQGVKTNINVWIRLCKEIEQKCKFKEFIN